MAESSPILLFEHEKKDCAEVGLSDEEVRRMGYFLSRVSRLWQYEPLEILWSESGPVVRATDHVGVLRFGERTIEVLPKLFREKVQSEPERRWNLREKATRNLLALLDVGGFGDDLRQSGTAPLLARRTDWFEVLTFLFAIHLQRELALGPAAGYVTREEILPFVRGRLLVEQMVRRPASLHHPMCRYDELTLDNPLNRVLLYTSRLLLRVTRLPENRKVLNDCIARLQDEVETLPFLTANQAESIVLTRLHERFRPLLGMACLFLRGSSIQMTSGRVESFCFFLDMNRVFEAAVIRLFTRHKKALGDPWNQMRPVSHSTRYLATRMQAPEQPTDVFQLQPDLVFYSGQGAAPLVIDAKYKRLEPDSGRWEVNPDDFYQMLAYATGFPGVERILLVYPWVGEPPTGLPRFRIKNFHRSDFEIVLGLLPLDLEEPLSKSSTAQRIVSGLAGIIRGGRDGRDGSQTDSRMVQEARGCASKMEAGLSKRVERT